MHYYFLSKTYTPIVFPQNFEHFFTQFHSITSFAVSFYILNLSHSPCQPYFKHHTLLPLKFLLSLHYIYLSYGTIRSEVQNGTINISYVPSQENWADVFTKPLPACKIQIFGKKLFGNKI